MTKPITVEQAIGNLPPITHLTFKRICDDYFQKNEDLYHAAYCTITDQVWEKDMRRWQTFQKTGVFVLTSYRILIGTFGGARFGEVTYATDKKKKDFWDWLATWRTWTWIPPQELRRYPDVTKLGREKWASKVKESIMEMPLFYQDKISRKEYRVRDKDKVIHLLVLYKVIHNKGKNNWFDIAFVHQDGMRIYDLLQQALQNDGRLSDINKSQSKQAARDNPADTLLMLKQLFDKGVLTEAEYQAKKFEVLSRL